MGLRKRALDVLRDRVGSLGALRRFEDDHELVAANAGDRVVLPHGCA